MNIKPDIMQHRHALIFTIKLLFSVLLIPYFFSCQALSQDNIFGEEDIKLIIRLAESGDAEAQFNYALLLDEGRSVAMDKPAAIFWFRKAAEQGDPAACLYLGMKYEYGNRVKQDPSQAIHWYRKAALQDWPNAQFYLGRMLLEKNDTVQAAAWLSLAEEWEYPGADEEKEKAVSLLSEQERSKAKKMQNKLQKQIEFISD